MSDEELIARLRKRADDDRKIQANNEVVATALKGQRLLFDQGFKSASNTFAVRLGLDYENCAKNDAKLAADWDAAADRIAALTAEVDLHKTRADIHLASVITYRERAEAAETKVARLEGAVTNMPNAVLRTTVCQGPVWPDDRPGVWLAALEACAKSVQEAVDAALTDGGKDG